MNEKDRFTILHRDGFACLYCGARPGNELLRVAHLLPRTMGGSDAQENLATTCESCDAGRAAVIAIPSSLCTGLVDKDNWHTWKRWGIWHLMFQPLTTACVLDAVGRDYPITIERVHVDVGLLLEHGSRGDRMFFGVRNHLGTREVVYQRWRANVLVDATPVVLTATSGASHWLRIRHDPTPFLGLPGETHWILQQLRADGCASDTSTVARTRAFRQGRMACALA